MPPSRGVGRHHRGQREVRAGRRLRDPPVVLALVRLGLLARLRRLVEVRERYERHARERADQEDPHPPVDHDSALSTSCPTYAITSAPGIVSTHAQTTWLATPQRTAETRCVDPTPTMAPVIVCVVDTGMPRDDVKKSVTAAADSAATPPAGCRRVILEPI